MTVVYPFSLTDQELALKNAQWMKELGGCRGHDVYVLYDARCQLAESILAELRKSFDQVFSLRCDAEIDGWPEGANYFFRLAAAKLETKPSTPYFMWMEPDAIPLSAHWLTDIEIEYEGVAKKLGKFFMGDRVQVENIPLHMSGVGIYPLPLHRYSGEAYRAAEVAWDMAGANQIVPKAHFTKLIEHAWKHPSFTNQDELKTQIRPEAVLFHSSKDGSLIDLLRKQMTAVPVLAESDTERSLRNAKGSEARESTSRDQSVHDAKTSDSCGGSQPIFDIFIRTYPADYKWLRYCLESVRKYCTGFRKVWIVSTAPASGMVADPWPDITDGSMVAEWKIMNEETEDGYLAQQIHKLYADTITGYQADYYLLLDSDTLFTKPVTPRDFFAGQYYQPAEKLVWYMTPYSSIETPWQPVTQAFMNKPVEYEFMRRLPMMVPKWLFSGLREYCHRIHDRIISAYIASQPYRGFSEFNALGAFAYAHHRDKFIWIDTTQNEIPAPLARQFYSWGGITDEVKKEIEGILNPKPEEKQAEPLNIPNGEVVVTLADEIRYHVGMLAELCHEKPSRRKQIVAELRKRKLVPVKFK